MYEGSNSPQIKIYMVGYIRGNAGIDGHIDLHTESNRIGRGTDTGKQGKDNQGHEQGQEQGDRVRLYIGVWQGKGYRLEKKQRYRGAYRSMETVVGVRTGARTRGYNMARDRGMG